MRTAKGRAAVIRSHVLRVLRTPARREVVENVAAVASSIVLLQVQARLRSRPLVK